MNLPEEVTELKRLLTETAKHILRSGRDVNPNLHLILPSGICIPTVVSWDENDKSLYFQAFSSMISALKPAIIGFSCEAWASKKPAGAWMMHAPSDDPQREDIFFCFIRTATHFELASAPIITKDGRRSLGPIEWRESNDVTGPLADIFSEM